MGDGETYGILGPPQSDDGSIVQEELLADGFQRVRLRHGTMVAPDQPRLGYIEQVLDVKPTLFEDANGRHLRIDTRFQTVEEQAPGGLAAVMWGFTLMGVGPGSIVGDVVFRVNGQPQTALARNGLQLDYDATDPLDGAALSAEIRLTYFDASLTLHFPLDDAGTARFGLSGLRVRGMFREQVDVRPPPFLPSSVVDLDGHFSINLPAEWGRCPIIDVHVWELDAKGARVNGLGPFPFQRDPSDDRPWLRIALDETVVGFWLLRGGPYLVRVELAEEGQTECAHVYHSATFTAADILAGLGLLLESFSRELFDVSLAEWKALRDKDADRARSMLWKGLAAHAAGFTASVEVTNRSSAVLTFSERLDLIGLFSEGPEQQGLASLTVDFGSPLAPTAQGAPCVPAGGTATVVFPPFGVAAPAGTPSPDRASALGGVMLSASPRRVGNRGPEQLLVGLLPPPLGSSDPRFVLGLAMRSTGSIDGSPSDPALYEKAMNAAFELPGAGDGTLQAYKQGKELAEGLYDVFLQLLEVQADALSALGDTGLGELEVVMNRYYSQHYGISFGGPTGDDAGPSLTAPSRPGDTLLPSGWSKQDFVLTNSASRTRWAAVGAAIDPGLSYAISSDTLATGPSPVDRTSPAASVKRAPVPGVDVWLWESDPARVLVAYAFDDGVRRSFDALVDSATHQISEQLFDRVWGPGATYDSALGRAHEELSHQQIFSQELDALKATYPGKLVLLGQDQICGVKSRQLTDGVIIGVKPDGTLEIVRVCNCKGGESSGSKAAEQVGTEAGRLRTEEVTLRNLTEQQRQDLGLTEAQKTFRPGELRANFADPNLFVVSLPSDVPPTGTVTVPDKYGTFTPEELTALQQGVNGARHTDYTAQQLSQVTDLLFAREGKTPHPWNDRALSFEGFKALTEQNVEAFDPLASPGPDGVLEDHFMRGERFNPETGRWERVFADWERPYMTPDEAFKIWDDATQGNKKRNVDVNRLHADNGGRYNPETGRWLFPTSDDAQVYTIDLRDPLLSDADYVRWTRKLKPAAQSLTDEEILAQRRTMSFDYRARTWTDVTDRNADLLRRGDEIDQKKDRGEALTPEEKALADEIKDAQRTRWIQRARFDPMEELNARRLAANEAAESAAWFASEAVDRTKAFLEELKKMSDEKLLVTVFTKDATVKVYVRLQLGDQIFFLTPAQQRAFVGVWYEHANHLVDRDELPDWLK